MIDLNHFHRFYVRIPSKSSVELADVHTGARAGISDLDPWNPGIPKVFLTTVRNEYSIIGATTGSIPPAAVARIRKITSQYTPDGQLPASTVCRLHVWSFPGMEQDQVKALSGELAYLIREKTRQWPVAQLTIPVSNRYYDNIHIAGDLMAMVNSDLRREELQRVYDVFQHDGKGWGLRGDRFLWERLKHYFLTNGLPDDAETFRSFLWRESGHITQGDFLSEKRLYVDTFNYGGMSGGWIDVDYWTNKGFQLLQDNFLLAVKR